MMILRRTFLIGIVGLAVLLVAPIVAKAENGEPLTDTQVAQIRGRCTSIQATLNRIHANDALLRVNQGQLYDKLSTKLMAPLNGRLALNRLNGTDLVRATSNYEVHLASFRSTYQNYEQSLSAVLRSDCENQPTTFYNLLETARANRVKVKKSVNDLERDITSYSKALKEFAKPYNEGKL